MNNQKFQQSITNLSNIITSVTLPLKAAGKEEQLNAIKSSLEAVGKTPVTVLVCGEFKRGKSTFINALLGQALCPTDTDICTSVASVIEYGPKAKATRYFGDFAEMKQEVIDIDDIEDFTVGTAEEIDNTIFIEIELPLETLKAGLTIIDTPGVGGLDPRHAALTNFLMPRADVAIFMTDVNEPMSSTEMAFYRDHVLRMAKNSLVVVNKGDLKSSDEVEEIRTDTVGKLKTYSGRTDAEIDAIAVSSVAEAYPDQGYGESNFAAMRKAIADKADEYRMEHIKAITADLVELINLALAPLQAQLDQIDSPDIDQVSELNARKAQLDQELANLTNPDSEFRNNIATIINGKREELITYLNTASADIQSTGLRKLMNDPKARGANGGQWMGQRLNDMLTLLASEMALRLNEMFTMIANMPEFGGNLHFAAKQFEVDIASKNVTEKLPFNKCLMAVMKGVGICTIGITILGQFAPALAGILFLTGAGSTIISKSVTHANHAHDEQKLREIYQPQISSSLSNMRTYVDTRFQEFQQEWLRVVTERAQSYRESVQESLTMIQQLKQQMAQAANMRVDIQNKMRPLKKAKENIAATI